MSDATQGGMIPRPSATSPSWAEPQRGCGYFIPATAETTAHNLRLINEAARKLKEQGNE